MTRRYRRNEPFRLEAPKPGPARETRSIAGLTTLGLIINPKTKEPVLATTDNAYVSIRSLRQESFLKKLGTGYHSDSPEAAADATDYPRVHTPSGVTVRGMGYGTALYSALCDGAHLRYEDLVEISMRVKGDGISSDTSDRSSEADRWWAAALKQGLTDEHREETEEVDEGVDVHADASDLKSCVSVDEGEITYVNTVNVDITKTTETVFDMYSYESLTEHHLVAGEVVHTLPGVLTDGTDLYVLWREALEDPDIIVSADEVALLALDVRGLAADAVDLLSLLYLKAGLKDAAVDALRERWERNLDPGHESLQGRLFRANAAGMADVQWARGEADWSTLESLP